MQMQIIFVDSPRLNERCASLDEAASHGRIDPGLPCIFGQAGIAGGWKPARNHARFIRMTDADSKTRPEQPPQGAARRRR